MADGAEPVEVVEVAHEALLRQWDTLERWLRELAAALSASELIRRSAKHWHGSNRDEALLVHTAHRLQAAEAVFSDERLEGRFEPIDGEYLAACRQRDRRELQEREEQLRRIAEQQSARAALQRRVTWGLSTAAVLVLALLVWIVKQTREVSLQTSLVLAGGAEAGADQKRFDQILRLGVLAARASWLRPAHSTAPPVLARAADASTLHTVHRTHRHRSLRQLQPRRQARGHGVEGQDGARLGRRHRQARGRADDAWRMGQLRQLQPRRQARGHGVGGHGPRLGRILVVAGPAREPDRKGVPTEASRQCPNDHRDGCARGQDSFSTTGRRGCLRRRADSAYSVSPRTTVGTERALGMRSVQGSIWGARVRGRNGLEAEIQTETLPKSSTVARSGNPMLLSASNFQEEQHQGPWTKRFSRRQRESRHKDAAC
jgi:hypothetical protein